MTPTAGRLPIPRIIDALDAAVGRTPQALEDDVDYLTLAPGPDTLIGPDRRYRAGWFERFDGQFNFEDTQALPRALQAWAHLSIDAPDHFIILNLAELGKAGQTALLVADKQTGRFRHGAETRMFARNQVALSPDFRHFRDGATGSMVRIHGDHDRWAFSIHVDDLHLVGSARRVAGPAFTQVTRFQRMRGSLQRYGNLAIEHAVLSMGSRVVELPPGTLGTFDHTVGHQRGIQSWNWVAAVGSARCASTGARTTLGIQVAQDRSPARPVVRSFKHVVWLEDRLYKIPSAAFDYGYTDADAKETGPWRITSPEGGPDTDRWLDLTFTPRFHRRERKSVVLVDADFNQYYGTLEGRIHVDGRTWQLDPLFAVTEESQLEL